MSCICAIFSDSCSEQERQLWFWPSTGEREQQMAAQYFPVSQTWGYLKAPVPFHSWGFASALKLHAAPTTGSWLRLASCMALGSSALGATTAAWKAQLRKKSQGQDVLLMYWSFSGYVSKHSVNLQMGQFQIITPDMVLALHQCVVLHGTGDAPIAIMDTWVGSSEVFMVHWGSNELGTTLLQQSL